METYREKIELETDYAKNGNSSGMQIDTLAIASGCGEYNSIYENNIDYIAECEHSAAMYWLDTEAESAFMESLTKEEASRYAEDLQSYENALKEYRDGLEESIHDLPEEHPLSIARQEAADAAEKEMRHDWLYGDYHGNFNGVLREAQKKLPISEGMTIDYDEKEDAVYLEFTSDDIGEAYENGYIGDKESGSFLEHVAQEINMAAEGKHKSDIVGREKRIEEAKKTREYRERMEKARKERKAEELRKLAESK